MEGPSSSLNKGSLFLYRSSDSMVVLEDLISGHNMHHMHVVPESSEKVIRSPELEMVVKCAGN